jgi:hypothetical protein
MDAYMGSRVIAPLILNLGCRGRSVVNFTSRPVYPQERTPVSIAEKAGLDVLEKRKIRCP